MDRRPGLVIETVAKTDSLLIEQLVTLGDTASDTLGMLRPAAYYEAASNGCLLVARIGGEIAGYVLFRRPRSEVVLTHVCVAREHRRSRVAQRLVDEVSARNSARHGLRAKCRDDYNIAAFWRALGFDRLGSAWRNCQDLWMGFISG